MIERLITAIRGNLIAWLALFVALGGTSLAASHYVINSTKQINPKVLKRLKGNHGPAGPSGPAGPKGPQGATGSVDTSKFFSKTESDGRYLGKGEQAADSAKLGGVAAAGYTTGEGSQGGRWLEMTDKSQEENFLFVPNIGELGLECTVTPTNTTLVKLTQHAGAAVFLTWGGYPKGQPTKTETAVLKEDDDSLSQAFLSTEHGTGQMIIQASVVTTPVHTYATITVSSSVTENVCRIQASYTVAEQRF